MQNRHSFHGSENFFRRTVRSFSRVVNKARASGSLRLFGQIRRAEFSRARTRGMPCSAECGEAGYLMKAVIIVLLIIHYKSSQEINDCRPIML